MTSQLRYTLILGLVLALPGQCSSQTIAEKESGHHGVVRFSEGWSKTVDGANLVFADIRGFVARKTRAPQAPELVFAMKDLVSDRQGGVRSVYSDEFYAVTLDGRFSVRSASAKDWEKAEQIPNTREQIRSNKHKFASAPPTHTENEVRYRGKLFAKTGKFWGNPVALVSPNGAWLAVFSSSSSAAPQESWSPLDGGGLNEPRPGEMFVDVYDTSSNQRILSNRAAYKSSPSMLFGGALWVADSYLVVPLDPLNDFDAAGQTCFLGILPSR